MSWLMYATRSTMRTIFPSSVSGSSGPVCLRIPSRTSQVRLSPRPSRSRRSTTRSECSLWRKPRPPCSRSTSSSACSPAPPERRMAEVVAEPAIASDEVLVQAATRWRDPARDAGRLECVREPRAEVIAFGVDEHLRLEAEPPKRLRVDDAVAVALKRRPQPAFLLRQVPSTRLVRPHGERRQPAFLVLPHEACEGIGNLTGELRHRPASSRPISRTTAVVQTARA